MAKTVRYNNSSKKIRLMIQYNSNTSIEEFVYKCKMDTIFEHLKIYEPNKKKLLIYMLKEKNQIYMMEEKY